MEKQYTINQVAEILGIQVRTARDWVRKKKLKAKKYEGGRIWLIPESEIERIQEEMK
jgi:excisionase family DNA binding protein